MHVGKGHNVYEAAAEVDKVDDHDRFSLDVIRRKSDEDVSFTRGCQIIREAEVNDNASTQ